eukprot:3609730-Prymnesium_polylepis.1
MPFLPHPRLQLQYAGRQARDNAAEGRIMALQPQLVRRATLPRCSKGHRLGLHRLGRCTMQGGIDWHLLPAVRKW